MVLPPVDEAAEKTISDYLRSWGLEAYIPKFLGKYLFSWWPGKVEKQAPTYYTSGCRTRRQRSRLTFVGQETGSIVFYRVSAIPNSPAKHGDCVWQYPPVLEEAHVQQWTVTSCWLAYDSSTNFEWINTKVDSLTLKALYAGLSLLMYDIINCIPTTSAPTLPRACPLPTQSVFF